MTPLSIFADSALPLLQTQYQFLTPANSRTIWLFAVILGLFLLFLIVGNAVRARRSRHLDPDQRRKYNRYVFRKMGKDIGLDKPHIEMLEYLVRVCKVKQPFLVFSNAGLLDDILKKGIYSLEQDRKLSAEARQARLSTIYQTKQLIERNSKRGVGIKSTNLLKSGQVLVIRPESGGQFPAKIVSNMRDMLACSVPREQASHPQRLKKGARVRVDFWRESDAGYSFTSKVLGYDNIKGIVSLLLQHAKTVRSEQQRKFRRRTLHRPCFFYPVEIMQQGTGRRSAKKAVVQVRQRLLGNLLDISAGGCSITSLSPLKSGQLLKMEFELDGSKRISVFGKVKRSRPQHHRGGIMHVMFTRLSSQYLNQIYSYVYDYAPPARSPLKYTPAQRR
jgi:c-di-GMP-binding flagellar brake protein YcgR